MSWQVPIAEPWELGPAGEQTVTVLSIDSAEHSVTLKREGSGDGWIFRQRQQASSSLQEWPKLYRGHNRLRGESRCVLEG